MKHIGFVISNLKIGGAERATVMLVNELSSVSGYRIHVFQLFEGDDFVGMMSPRVNLCQLKSDSTLEALTKLRRASRAIGLDYLFTVADGTAHYGMIASMWVSTQHVMISHTNWSRILSGSKIKKKLLWILLFLSGTFAKFWIFVSRGSMDSYGLAFPLCRPKMKVIPNAVLDDKFDEIISNLSTCSQRPFIEAVVVGRLVYAKGVDIALRAVKIAVDNGVGVILHVVGSGPMLCDLQAEVECLGIPSNVIFHGSVVPPYQILAQSDIYIHSSRWDALPTTLIEAQAIGVYSIANRCDYGPSEIMLEGSNGVLVDVDETGWGIAQEIMRFRKDVSNRHVPFAGVYKYRSKMVATEFLGVVDGH